MAANMKAVKLRNKNCGKHHADYQGYGTCGVLQAAKGQGAGRYLPSLFSGVVPYITGK